jgi:hypothetical protein
MGTPDVRRHIGTGDAHLERRKNIKTNQIIALPAGKAYRRVRSRGLSRNQDVTGTSHWMRRRKTGAGHTRGEYGLPQQGIPGRLINAMRLLLAARAGDDGLPKLNH